MNTGQPEPASPANGSRIPGVAQIAGVGRRLGVPALVDTASSARDKLAGQALAVLRSIPDGRLDQLLRTPIRHVIIGGIFHQVPGLIDTSRSGTLTTSIRWRIIVPGGGVDVYNLVLEEGAARIARGLDGPEPRATITVEAREFLKLATGNSNPLASYFTGKLVLTGNVMAATKVASLIRFQDLLARS
jgi:SCP-2 sterol transfer family